MTGVMLSRLIVSLDGKPISLRGAALNGRGANYELLLPVSRGNPAGLYAVALRPGGGVRAVANGALAETQTALHWGYRRSLGMVPDAPTSIAPRAVSQSGQRTVVTLGWSAPRGNGGGVVTGYEAQYRATGDGAWLAVRGPIPASGSPTATVSGMSLGREYEFRVAARNAAGLGAFAVSRPFVIKVGAGDDLSQQTLPPI